MKHSIIATQLRAALRYPVYFAQLFTGAKSFTANPIIGNRMLNRLGLHVFRVVLAAGISHFRFFCLRGFVTADQRAAYHRDGYLLITNFLADEEFDRLNQEVRSMRGEVRECVQGDTLTHRILLSERFQQQQPRCRALLDSEHFSKLMRYTSACNTSPVYYVQSIKSNVVDGKTDPQRTLHSDTFHPTMKAWLFLDDVSDRNGPLTYVAGSHRLTLKRLLWEYRNSVAGSDLDNSYAARGSLRLDQKQLPALGFPQPTAFRVPANTLVIANTNGFHCRGAATGGPASRLELWAYSRSNPFNPWPGLNFGWYRSARDFAIEYYLQREDRKAAAKGACASWHVVSQAALNEPVAESAATVAGVNQDTVEQMNTSAQAVNSDSVKRREVA